MQQDILNDILPFLEKAGKLALENQATAANELKADNSIVTETDLAISKMAHETFASWLAQEGHLLIDEETINDIGKPEEVFENSTYQWVLDPIDGTANYACGRREFGTMISVLKNGKPWVAALYQPGQGDLVYGTLEDGVFHVKQPFTDSAVTTQLTEINARPLHRQTFFELNEKSLFAIPEIMNSMWPSLSGSAINGNMHALLARGSGQIMSLKVSCWDVTACWSLFQMLKTPVFAFNARQPIETLTGALFKDNWKVTDNLLFAPEEVMNTLHTHIKNAQKKDAA